MRGKGLSGISTGFPVLSQSYRQVAHVLLTRSPLEHPPEGGASFDLHVLSTPPAFVLSQDQTLRECLPVIGCTHHESGTTTGIRRSFTASSLCFLQRNLAPADAGDGVSTYLALIFGTLLSSQGTDASFVLTLSGFPPGASLRSCVSDSIRPFPDPISSALSR